MALIDYKTVYEKLDTKKGPTCALCVKRVDKATLIANGFDNPKIRVECHGQCYTETIGPWIARDRDKLYDYLRNFSTRTLFEDQAKEARRNKITLAETGETFGNITAEAMKALKWRFRDRLDEAFYETYNKTDPPRRYETYTSDRTDPPRSYTVYRDDTNFQTSIDVSIGQPAQPAAPAKAVKPIELNIKQRVIRFDD